MADFPVEAVDGHDIQLVIIFGQDCQLYVSFFGSLAGDHRILEDIAEYSTEIHIRDRQAVRKRDMQREVDPVLLGYMRVEIQHRIDGRISAVFRDVVDRHRVGILMKVFAHGFHIAGVIELCQRAQTVAEVMPCSGGLLHIPLLGCELLFLHFQKAVAFFCLCHGEDAGDDVIKLQLHQQPEEKQQDQRGQKRKSICIHATGFDPHREKQHIDNEDDDGKQKRYIPDQGIVHLVNDGAAVSQIGLREENRDDNTETELDQIGMICLHLKSVPMVHKGMKTYRYVGKDGHPRDCGAEDSQ